MPWQNNGGGWQSGGDNRNPWGNGGRGGGGGQQPPNFDDLVKKGQERLKGALPGGIGGRNGLLLLLAIFLGIWAVTGFYTVKANEQGVVLRFGEPVAETPPGLHWHLPYPIETALTPQVTDENRVEIGFRSGPTTRSSNFLNESLMLTGDENIVDIGFSVVWRIAWEQPGAVTDYLFNVAEPLENVRSVAESAMREVVGKSDIRPLLTEGRDQVQTEVRDLMQNVLDEYQAGVQVLRVQIERSDPPQQVIDAFRDVQAAEADRERFRNEAEAYANSIIPEARGQAVRLVQQAEAYREEVIARATGEASRFTAIYNEYLQAKDVTRQRIYLETMEEILAGMEKIIIDDKAGSGVVPYLPLPEVQGQRERRQGGNNE